MDQSNGQYYFCFEVSPGKNKVSQALSSENMIVELFAKLEDRASGTALSCSQFAASDSGAISFIYTVHWLNEDPGGPKKRKSKNGVYYANSH